MQAEFQAQIRNLQQQYKEIFQSTNRIIDTKQNNSSVEEVRSDSSVIDKFIKDFEERCEFVETNTQTVTERLDSCEQKFFKMRSKTETVEQQIASLQQRVNNIEINDTNMQTIETSDVQQETASTLGMNSKFDSIEQALCQPYEREIKLSSDEVQYGVYGICDKYNVILMKEKDKLKLFDYHRQIDESPGGELEFKNYGTCIHWCEFLDQFLILYRLVNSNTWNQSEFIQ